MTMVVGVFENLVNAQHAVADLVTSGYARNNISVLVRNVESRPTRHDDREHGALARAANAISSGVLAGGPLAKGLRRESEAPTEQAVARTLQTAGLRPAAASFFADAICNGAILVAVHCAEPYVRNARDILDVYTDSGGEQRRPERSTLS